MVADDVSYKRISDGCRCPVNALSQLATSHLAAPHLPGGGSVPGRALRLGPRLHLRSIRRSRRGRDLVLAAVRLERKLEVGSRGGANPRSRLGLRRAKRVAKGVVLMALKTAAEIGNSNVADGSISSGRASRRAKRVAKEELYGDI